MINKTILVEKIWKQKIENSY